MIPTFYVQERPDFSIFFIFSNFAFTFLEEGKKKVKRKPH